MALLEVRNIEDAVLGIWDVTEDEDNLIVMLHQSTDLLYLDEIHATERRKEWLAVRVLLQQIWRWDEDIYYDEFGGPILKSGEGFVSVSHSHGRVMVMVSTIFQPSVDIELMGDKIRRIRHKFVGKTEELFLGDSSGKDELHVIWGAKEVLFKHYRKGNIDFKRELEIAPFVLTGESKIKGFIKKETIEQQFLQYEKIDNWMLVYLLNR